MEGGGAVIVNVVSQVPSAIWERELPDGLSHDYIHTAEPAPADIHVIYGLRSEIEIPNSRSRIIFVASEPPEIREYNLKVLRRYRRVLAPAFPYLAELPNYSSISAVAPWWVGTHAGGKEHYKESAVRITLSRENLVHQDPPSRDVLSVIVSAKARTPLQQQRLRFVDYLEKKMGNVEVWGENRRFTPDKADVLTSSRYHLAIENSQHPGYWTEKLSDPLLMSNFVFYQGDPVLEKSFDSAAIQRIDCFDLDSSYRTISESMDADAWTSSVEARENNRRTLLDRLSFHRVLDGIIGDGPFGKLGKQKTIIPAQHPVPLWKQLSDPLYKVARNTLGR